MDLKDRVATALSEGVGNDISVHWNTDSKGVMSGWCRLQEARLILPAGQAIARLAGRLSAVTAYLSPKAKLPGAREVAYHFDLDGTNLTVTVELPLIGASIPSLTPIFRNADWNEREFMELYDIQVAGHPAPRPLFLDKTIEPAVLERLVPYSAFTNAAAGKTIWEKVLPAKSEEDAR